MASNIGPAIVAACGPLVGAMIGFLGAWLISGRQRKEEENGEGS